MSGVLYRDPIRAIAASTVFPGAACQVLDESGDMASIFADHELATPLQNPHNADVAGRLPAIYVPIDEARYRFIASDSTGVVIDESGIAADIVPIALTAADPRDSNGALMPNATRTFYASGTNELLDVYTGDDLVTPLTNPVTADSNGNFPDTYLDPELVYRVLLKDRNGRLIYDVEHSSASIGPTAPVLAGEFSEADFDPETTAIDLSWTASESAPSPIAGYRLYDASDDSLIVDQPGLTYTFGPPLTEDTTYSFYVVAYNEAGIVSPRSNTISLVSGHPDTIVEIFDVAGEYDWMPHPALVTVDVEALGAGGGGGGGGIGSEERVRCGGWGGGGGGKSQTLGILAAAVPAGVTITVGAGGPGGAGFTSASSAQSGSNGTNGGASTFGALCVAGGGTRGQGGVVTGGGSVSGNGAGGAGTLADGGDGGHSQTSGTTPGSAGGDSTLGGGGGGAGASLTGGLNVARGSDGGDGNTSGTPSAGGVAPTICTNAEGHDGADGAGLVGGAGGSGGHVSCGAVNSIAGSGGDGGKYGGGGGGGGACQNFTGLHTTGSGGKGGGGYVKVTSYLS